MSLVIAIVLFFFSFSVKQKMKLCHQKKVGRCLDLTYHWKLERIFFRHHQIVS